MRTCFDGRDKIGLYSASVLVGFVEYPAFPVRQRVLVGHCGPTESTDARMFADDWKRGYSIEDLQAKYPTVVYRPNR